MSPSPGANSDSLILEATSSSDSAGQCGRYRWVFLFVASVNDLFSAKSTINGCSHLKLILKVLQKFVFVDF